METDCVEADRTKRPVYSVPEWIRGTHSQDGAIVLDIRHGKIFNLNYVGSRILEALQNHSGDSQSDIAGEISREFGISRGIAENDVRTFLGELAKSNLIEEHSPESALEI